MMKYIMIVSLLLIFSCLCEAQPGYIIRDVTVIPLNKEGSIDHQAVVIREGKIAAIVPDASVRPGNGEVVINGSGKYLVPGFFDMHAHFFYEQGAHVNTCETELGMMLANGLTTVRIMAGHPAYLEAKNKVKEGEWKGPELFVASPQLVGRWPWPAEFKNFEIVDTREKAAFAVREFKRIGYDAIKITFMVTAEAYDEIVKTASEVGMKVVGHVGPQVKLPAALAAGEQIEHMDEFIDQLLPDTTHNHGQSVSDMNIWRKAAWATVPYLDERKLPALARQVKEAGVFVSPTNYFFISCFGEGQTEEEIRSSTEYEYIPAAIKEERWKVRQHYLDNAPSKESREKYVALRKKMVYELWKAGVPLMAGSDSPEWFLVQGFAIHDELEMFVKSGLTPLAALQTATVNPAKHLGIDGRLGTIEQGKEADLIMLDRDPLKDIRNTQAIYGVFTTGKWFDKPAINKLLQAARVKE